MSKKQMACIIDDDQVYVFGVKKLIQFYDFCSDVLTFKNGEEALDYLDPRKACSDLLPEVIMVDINMPVMDGWEFLDNFVKMTPTLSRKITVYVVSSSLRQDDMEKAKNYSEVTDYIVKPVNFENLKQILSA
ncbi:Response regulator receiver domain-containing protein [Filimonas lacunae]|uniref:Response regulator receiver domain-containing protein n=1 Tax=Filimonas lacunae TaxID=477680 RepID=A0A173MPH8_9BACT|nr:response regulator [Filimonas lacunae]BAV09552.1 two-component response regulator [Filimonas lacunae]SIS75092.1 Response regulator receiver domain-containing protein [Filimonas lacunae]